MNSSMLISNWFPHLPERVRGLCVVCSITPIVVKMWYAIYTISFGFLSFRLALLVLVLQWWVVTPDFHHGSFTLLTSPVSFLGQRDCTSVSKSWKCHPSWLGGGVRVLALGFFPQLQRIRKKLPIGEQDKGSQGHQYFSTFLWPPFCNFLEPGECVIHRTISMEFCCNSVFV